MSNVKLLVSSLPNIGKTTLLSTLEDTLVIARDGKIYPFPQPHVNVSDYSSVGTLIDTIVEAVEKYEQKMGNPPKIIAIDSISKILLDIEAYVLEQVKSYPYGKVNTEIKTLVDFIESEVCPNFDVVLLSHAMYNEDTIGYSLVNAGGAYGKKGGMLSEVDEAIFLELKGKERIVHFRNSKMASRTTMKDWPDSMPATEFNLQDHVKTLRDKKSEAAKWTLY